MHSHKTYVILVVKTSVIQAKSCTRQRVAKVAHPVWGSSLARDLRVVDRIQTGFSAAGPEIVAQFAIEREQTLFHRIGPRRLAFGQTLPFVRIVVQVV